MEDTSIRVESIELTDEWDKVFPLSDEVKHRKETFVNHFGNTLAADLYEAKEYTDQLSAIVVSGPFGAVKEQSSGLSAQEKVDPEQIGLIGICGWGGRALQTAALDTRVKATAVMTMYDMCCKDSAGKDLL